MIRCLRPIKCNLPKHILRKNSTFTQAVTNPANRTQIYISQSLNPYVNLSIETYFLLNTPVDSTILFLYSNRPSIILGRNQNPWHEVNLGLLRSSLPETLLVRRRSGGGTVFHDEGNVNYSVISPMSTFTRQKHADMIVRALRSLNVEKVSVNQRHDIVIEKFDKDEQSLLPFKISGTAFKLTKYRSLHHGTCLLSSPYIKVISRYLDPPIKPFLTARGVNSVKSKITNVWLSNEEFQKAVIEEFQSMYTKAEPIILDENIRKIPEIVKDEIELKSHNWIYNQTPQFEFAIDNNSECPFESGMSVGTYLSLPKKFNERFLARNGRIISASPALGHLINQELYSITDWRPKLSVNADTCSSEIQEKLGDFLNKLMSGDLNQLQNTFNRSPN
ncbi:Bgt-96 [Blumeria graminis f. sp. tritici]|uniref:Putative lipoate-protein ligase A n=2 Tax=Blumeria graminis f. sp. tritici TaxID=62690 RepID=A0A061HPS2_BLUGR|nr:lipoate-protein ligase [Blumeria graminis f. sp. tritici 96224]VCU41383.1 Bgt-96 [Blumeria graminis f. sp. tritici]